MIALPDKVFKQKLHSNSREFAVNPLCEHVRLPKISTAHALK